MLAEAVIRATPGISVGSGEATQQEPAASLTAA